MQLDLDVTDVLNAQPILRQLAAVTVPVFDRSEPLRWLEARKARFLTDLEATKEGGKRLVEAPEKLLHGGWR